MKKPYVRYRDHTGEKFGRLTVVKFQDYDGPSCERSRWLCRCECGKEAIVPGKRLRSGNTRSCGCIKTESSRASAKILSEKARKYEYKDRKTPEFRSWKSMISRCTLKTHPTFHNYGGRGIKVCERWLGRLGFVNFLEDMGPRPSNLHSIDRFPDVNGIYEPANCRWATKTEQGRNTRFNLLLTFNGETLCLAEWSERTGLKRTTISQRLKRGWTTERALTTAL